MSFTVCGIPMVQIPHPQGAWLEGVNPVTNLQWQKGVEPLMSQGARYCLLEPHYRGDLMVRQFGDLRDVLDTVGRDNVPIDWDGRDAVEREITGRGVLALFQWFPKMSRPRFDRDHQPVIDVSWYHAKGWVLSQGNLYLLTGTQWEWSGQGGERRLQYATESGNLFGTEGRKLIHGSVGMNESTTIEVEDPRYPDGPFGLRHKSGNVSEFVERDLGDEDPYVVRGGSWIGAHAHIFEVVGRGAVGPGTREERFGFRVGAASP